MWAQLITVRLKEGARDEAAKLLDQLRAVEQPDSGWVRTSAMIDQSDPPRLMVLVVFESEEKARARESDPRREPGLVEARATMAEMFDGGPVFTDLNVLGEVGP